MAEKLIIIMMNTDPEHSAEVTAPLFQATIAASMEYAVEVLLTGRSGVLARVGVADNIHLQHGGEQTVYDLIREAHEAGVIFRVCTPAVEDWGNELIPEIDETVGSAYVVAGVMDDDTVTLTY